MSTHSTIPEPTPLPELDAGSDDIPEDKINHGDSVMPEEHSLQRTTLKRKRPQDSMEKIPKKILKTLRNNHLPDMDEMRRRRGRRGGRRRRRSRSRRGRGRGGRGRGRRRRRRSRRGRGGRGGR